MLLTLAGPPSLSSFRLAALEARCRRRLPQLHRLRAAYLYIVQLERELTPSERERLEEILESPAPDPGPAGLEVLVCPRPGTLSPWSSKATDILHHCGLDAVVRLERGTRYRFAAEGALSPEALDPLLPLLHDRMTEALLEDPAAIFRRLEPQPLRRFPLRARGRKAVEAANSAMGLALSPGEIDYLVATYTALGRDPTDVELMMFSVVNSEHCRHKIFNAEWIVDGRGQERSLFEMIRNTHARNPAGCLRAYSDNAAVIRGFAVPIFFPREAEAQRYGFERRQTHLVIKVETHNHPTAISPYPGASTGVGGEIRDEGATGVGGRPQAGLCAFFTSNLRLPGFVQPWEKERAEFPARLATPLEIMSAGPLGGAGFGNEFGRPNLLGIFRTFEAELGGRYRAYHKPIMVAGGVGLIDAAHLDKQRPRRGDWVVQIGGPALLIGLGGGAASSMDTGSNLEELDFASVQRDNPEMQRRCHELICRCIALGADNPILSLHDIGAGGLSNACPELVRTSGARFDLRAIPNDDPGMSPMQIWCNEAQERYVLVVERAHLERFAAMARRERCPFARIGEISGDGRISLRDPLFDNDPIEALELELLLGKPPRLRLEARHLAAHHPPLDLEGVSLGDALARVLRFAAVAAKSFLITIADRSVGGLVARDQMVGPYQTPIADLALTAHSFKAHTGSAMAMGERAPLALIDAPASGRMAVAEAITNIAAAAIGPIGHIKLSANWMCACGEEGEDALLYDTVRALGMEFCPALGVAIPVGKDSLSMRAVWEDSQGRSHKAVAPLSLVVSAFAPVRDIRRALTPDLKREAHTRLLLVDLGGGRNRLGGSALAQVYNQMGDESPDVDPEELRNLYHAVQELIERELILAYHDRADGGLLVSALEMAFGSRSGLHLDLETLGSDPLAALFSEEIGVLVQYRAACEQEILAVLGRYGLRPLAHCIGHPTEPRQVEISCGGRMLFSDSTLALLQAWSELSYRMQAHRDHPECAREEYEALADPGDPGMNFHLSFAMAPPSVLGTRPRVAVLREQGVNGQVEMAAAFEAAGFDAVDVSMTDLLEGRTDLAQFQGLAACGGFSYGDVLGAGAGWARSILFHEGLRQLFAAFFARPDTFSLGVCNGCQMFSLLKELIPGAQAWPRFVRNRSEQFEARYVTVEVLESRSILLRDMAGSRLPVVVAHGEGRAAFAAAGPERLRQEGLLCMRYVDHGGCPTERYPFNPNGSPQGITSLTSTDGRATIMMPHPERLFRAVQLSWRPPEWTRPEGPWLRLFQNARAFAAQS